MPLSAFDAQCTVVGLRDPAGDAQTIAITSLSSCETRLKEAKCILLANRDDILPEVSEGSVAPEIAKEATALKAIFMLSENTIFDELKVFVARDAYLFTFNEGESEVAENSFVFDYGELVVELVAAWCQGLDVAVIWKEPLSDAQDSPNSISQNSSQKGTGSRDEMPYGY